MSSICEIRETAKYDLENIMHLWNNGEVMSFVGFPNGTDTTMEEMSDWFEELKNSPNKRHYSIYTDEIEYCGETFYNVINAEHRTACLDIKLLPAAQGKGIAQTALKFAINDAFNIGNAERVYVEPHPDNHRAWALYERLGFKSKPRPKYLYDADTYIEITKDEWNNKRCRKFGAVFAQ